MLRSVWTCGLSSLDMCSRGAGFWTKLDFVDAHFFIAVQVGPSQPVRRPRFPLPKVMSVRLLDHMMRVHQRGQFRQLRHRIDDPKGKVSTCQVGLFRCPLESRRLGLQNRCGLPSMPSIGYPAIVVITYRLRHHVLREFSSTTTGAPRLLLQVDLVG